MASRREEYSSKVVRTLNPNRPISPAKKNASIENLDHLLEDLETTVNRTASHLNAANAASAAEKARDVRFLKPANSTTVVEERSVSPGLAGSKSYKTKHYEYSSSGNSDVPPANVDQLDNLLSDLRTERNIPFDKEINLSNGGIDSGLLEPNSRVKKTTRTVTTTTNGGSPKPSVKFESPSLVSEVLRSPQFKRRTETTTQTSRDVKYDTEPIITSPPSTLQRSHEYSKTTSSTNRTVPINTDIVEVETTDLPLELKNANLPEDLKPQPGTKITTTIKTFSYDIPNDTKVPANKQYSYKNEYYNSSNSKTTTTDHDIPPTEKYVSGRSPTPGRNETYLYKKETTSNTTNDSVFPPSTFNPPSLGPNQTYYYKREVNETKNNVMGPPSSALPPRPRSPTTTSSYYERNESSTNNRQHPPGGFPAYPNGDGPKQMYYYKKETSNTTNTTYRPPDEPVRAPSPVEPITKLYKYTKETTTTNTTSQREPRLPPFPTDNVDRAPRDNGQPPKQLDQLLANFDDKNIDDAEPYVPRKEINTAVAEKPSTKNAAGPPVFYPPKPLFEKSEAQAAWRGRGAMGKGSGNYEYEAEKNAKSTKKSGAAVVPVCLPLCCAMPCSIM